MPHCRLPSLVSIDLWEGIVRTLAYVRTCHFRQLLYDKTGSGGRCAAPICARFAMVGLLDFLVVWFNGQYIPKKCIRASITISGFLVK